MRIKAKEIIERAKSQSGVKYWYGGKGDLACKGLADTLRERYPKIWTQTYYNKALKDIDGTTRVGDCSYLVCHAYKWGFLKGSSLIKETCKEWKGTPKPGMIAWKPGHVGIVSEDGVHVLELAGIDADYREDRTIQSAGFTNILYCDDVDYGYDYENIGWNKDEHGWWYSYGHNKGDYYKDGFYKINGRWFCFMKNGYLARSVKMREDGSIKYGISD